MSYVNENVNAYVNENGSVNENVQKAVSPICSHSQISNILHRKRIFARLDLFLDLWYNIKYRILGMR